jgi:spore coat protein U-like protein
MEFVQTAKDCRRIAPNISFGKATILTQAAKVKGEISTIAVLSHDV